MKKEFAETEIRIDEILNRQPAKWVAKTTMKSI